MRVKFVWLTRIVGCDRFDRMDLKSGEEVSTRAGRAAGGGRRSGDERVDPGGGGERSDGDHTKIERRRRRRGEHEVSQLVNREEPVEVGVVRLWSLETDR